MIDGLEIDRMYDDIKSLLKALEPFASVAEWDISDNEDGNDPFIYKHTKHNYAPPLLVGHLRDAMEVYNAVKDYHL
jgi:hypothetical protein